MEQTNDYDLLLKNTSQRFCLVCFLTQNGREKIAFSAVFAFIIIKQMIFQQNKSYIVFYSGTDVENL